MIKYFQILDLTNYEPSDCKLLRSKDIESRVRKLFDKTDLNINLYFGQWNTFFYIDPKSINVLFTHNIASDKYPMTPWIMAHRIGHALFDRGQNENFNFLQGQIYGLINEFYDTPADGCSGFFEKIGTTRACRHKKLFRHTEFFCEIYAQWLLTGHIKFNKLPQSFSKKNWYNNKDAKKYIGPTNKYVRQGKLRKAIIEFEEIRQQFEKLFQEETTNAIGQKIIL